MGIGVYSPEKGRLITLQVELTPENTTYFDKNQEDGQIYWIADSDYGLLIKTWSYNYPLLLQSLSRRKIRYSKKKALELYRRETT